MSISRITPVKGVELDQLGKAHAAFMLKYTDSGKPITRYKCKDCSKFITIPKPDKSMLPPNRACWSSARTCPFCGSYSAVNVYPSGTVRTSII